MDAAQGRRHNWPNPAGLAPFHVWPAAAAALCIALLLGLSGCASPAPRLTPENTAPPGLPSPLPPTPTLTEAPTALVPPSLTPTPLPPLSTPSPTAAAASATAVPSPTAPTPAPPTRQPFTPTPRLAEGQLLSPKDGMILLPVPAGEFEMGSYNDEEDEYPTQIVYLDAYHIDRTEVTNAMFNQFVLATGYKTDAEKAGSSYGYINKNWLDIPGASWQHPQGAASSWQGREHQPVIFMSWNDANAYCTWAGRRLPREAEWEKAARGTDKRTYPWGNQPPSAARLNFNKNIFDTTPVGTYPSGASPYGALDMAGNAWEWVADWYGPYRGGLQRNPTGPATGEFRVLRGGSWLLGASFARTTLRGRNVPEHHNVYNSFRCAQ